MSARRVAAALAWWALAAIAPARAAAVVAPGEGAAPPAVTVDARCPPSAVAPTPDEVAAGMRDAVDHGLLWKATKAGRVLYLYGTIHVAKLGWMFPGPHMLGAIKASDTVAMEIDVTDPAVLERWHQAVLRRPDAAALPPALARRLDAQMALACLAPQDLASLRFEMQAITLDVMQGRQLGLYPDYGIDGMIAQLATRLRKPVIGLETPELQAGLIMSDDPAETRTSVGDVLDELEGGKSAQVLRRLADDWQRGDLADMSAYASWCECQDTPQQRADFVKLIDDRNLAMADKIATLHADGKKLFVAVGSLHMIGRVGLPALLQARGFKVERVPLRNAPEDSAPKA